ncbi:MAG: hypothetical protein LBE59_06985 [Nevskiaceae bacterium]|jgi:hypothetical protein|nr:hypothetical protein [Nevskiaceae bacterium]
MRIFGGLAALGLLVACSAGADQNASQNVSQDAAQPLSAAHPKGHYDALNALPDWGGVWVLARQRRGPNDPAPEQPAFKGEYLAKLEAWQKEVRDNAGVVRKDRSNCMPPGMPGMMGTGQYPIEFLFTPGRVTMHVEAWMQWRSVYTDGRTQPDDWEAGIFGFSAGHWEGDTLVVETTGIKPITELQTGVTHGPNLKISERFHLDPENPDQLVLEMTLEDPDALEKPWNRRFVYNRQRDWSLIEFICAENDRNPVDAEGHTQFE